MLIVCPNCTTSYMIDAHSVGAGGRMVRCARCKDTWYVKPPAPENDVTAFVDSVIAEAEAQQPPRSKAAPRSPPITGIGAADDDFTFVQQTAQDRPGLPQAAWDAAPPSDSTPSMPSAFDAPFDSPPLVDHAANEIDVHDAPPLVPEQMAAPEPEVQEDVENIVSRRKRRTARRKKPKLNSRWTAVILVLFATNVALIGARQEVVRFLPQTASLFSAIGLPVNLRNLVFEGVKITRETQDGTTVLLIEGFIVSTSNKPVDVPRLRFAARNAGGQEIYVWTARPERAVLGGGESMPFSSRLAAPPADANDVMVRFFTAHDAANGGK